MLTASVAVHARGRGCDLLTWLRILPSADYMDLWSSDSHNSTCCVALSMHHQYDDWLSIDDTVCGRVCRNVLGLHCPKLRHIHNAQDSRIGVVFPRTVPPGGRHPG
jgi:hypothetical protein